MAISDTKLRTIYGKPYSGPQEVADADGLSVRISPKGVIQFQYRYRWHGKPNRLGLGRYPSLSLKDARQITADLRKLYFSGTDPRTYFEEKVENSMTVAQCLDYWFDNYVSTTLREKTQALYRSTVMKRMHDAFPNRPASSITVKQWVDLLTEEERDNPRRARQVLSQLRSAISWCMRRQLIDSCAIMSIQPRDFGSRAEVGIGYCRITNWLRFGLLLKEAVRLRQISSFIRCLCCGGRGSQSLGWQQRQNLTCWTTYGPYRKSIARWVMLSAVQSSNKLSLFSKRP